MKKICFLLLISIVFFLYPEEVVILPHLQNPNSILADSKQLYFADGATVLIYSRKDYRLIKKFGKKGEGPQEFKASGIGVKIRLSSDQIIVQSVGRLSFFTKEGNFIEQRDVNLIYANSIQIGNKYVCFRQIPNNKGDRLFISIELRDSNFKKEKEIYKFKNPMLGSKYINPFDLRVCSCHIYKNKIFFDDEKGNINVYNDRGMKLYTIKMDLGKVKANETHREKFIEQWKGGFLKFSYKEYKDRIKFPDHLPLIRDFHVTDDRIYVLTHKEKEGKSEMIILNLEGKIQKRTFVYLLDIDMLIPLFYNYYVIKNNRIFRLVENTENDKWELHISKIE